MKSTTVKQALQYVADYPEPLDGVGIQMPAHEAIARILFDIANRPDASVRGSMTRANLARKLILDRLTGRRRAGTTPATNVEVEVEFVDLTGGGVLDVPDATPGQPSQ